MWERSSDRDGTPEISSLELEISAPGPLPPVEIPSDRDTGGDDDPDDFLLDWVAEDAPYPSDRRPPPVRPDLPPASVAEPPRYATDRRLSSDLPAADQVGLREFFEFQNWIARLRSTEEQVLRPLISDRAYRDALHETPANRLCQQLAELADRMERFPDAIEHPGAWLAKQAGLPEVLGRVADLALLSAVTGPVIEPSPRPVHLAADGLRLLGMAACTHDLGSCPCGRALTHEAAMALISPRLARLRDRYWNEYLDG
jgi:hypothetical protein